MIRTLLRYFKPHRKLFLLDMLCAVLASCVDLMFPYASRRAMYSLLPEKAYRAFFTVMLIVAASFVLRASATIS